MAPSGYLLVYEKIRIQLDCGQLLPGDALRSEKELAELHDVSRTTLRKALSRLESEGRIVRRPGIGNFVCQNAPAAEPPRPLNIGIEISDGFAQSPFLMQILQHSQNAATEHHANLLLKTADELCAARGIDAAVFTLIADNNYQRIAELTRRIPVILINRIPALSELSYVAVDYEDTVRRVISRLLSNGAHRILFIGGSPTPAYYAPYPRESGYRKAYAEHQLPVDDRLIIPHPLVPDIRRTANLLREPSRRCSLSPPNPASRRPSPRWNRCGTTSGSRSI